jgi:hypothetical protein
MINSIKTHKIKIALILVLIIKLFFKLNVTEASSYEFVQHSFNDSTDTDLSLTYSSNIISVVSESKSAPGSMISTSNSAKHYTITFNQDYDSISIVDISSRTASGMLTPRGFYVAKIEKQNSRVWKVWFNRVASIDGFDFYNGYVRRFGIITGRNIVTHSFYDDEVSPLYYTRNTDISLTYSGNIANIVSESKSAPGNLFSTSNSAKHYTITFNNQYDFLPIGAVSRVSASGRDKVSNSVAKIEKINQKVWKVWFNTRDGENGYTNRFEIISMPPTVRDVNTTNIGYNTAKINWTYIRSNDASLQDRYAIELATDSAFTNIVYSNAAIGPNTSKEINGLVPGTNYYPRIQVRNARGVWSDWSYGPIFTTQLNNPPILDQLNCGGITTGYTSANINWNYTGTDEPGDILELKARWRREGEVDWTFIDLLSNTRTGNEDITGLISGYKYELQISLNDNINTSLGNRWKGCGTITPTNYPEPNVSFNLEKLGDSTTRVSSGATGATLTVGTTDKVAASWSITDSIGVKDNSCKISSTNITGGNTTEIYNRTGLGFSSDSLVGNVPVDTNDQTYAIKLECEGKPAQNKRDINRTITLNVESYPVVSCSIDGTNTVKEGESNVNLRVNIDNVIGEYTWKSGVDINNRDINTQSGSSSTNDLSITLDYSGIKFGKYNPWVEITKNTKNILKTCGTVSNLGSSTIREVN